MGYRVHCDWCGGVLSGGEFAELSVSIKRKRRSVLDAKWNEEVRPTLHFCVPSNEGHDRMGIDSPESDEYCYERAVAAIKGTTTQMPDMGMEWRLVKVGSIIYGPPKTGHEPDADLADILRHLPPQFRNALPRAGITTLAQLDAMTDEQILAIKGIGPSVLVRLREAPRTKKAS